MLTFQVIVSRINQNPRKWAEKQGVQGDALTRASDGKQECV
jgi:hypothetical protein